MKTLVRALPHRGTAMLTATLVALTLIVPFGAIADVFPHPASTHESDDEPWRRMRLLIDGGWAFPVLPDEFASYWKAAPGVGLALVKPITEMVDLVARGELYDLEFDAREFEQDFGVAADRSPGRTSVSPVVVSIRIHRLGEGLRPFADVGIGLMDISRPAVFYAAPSGPAVMEGAEVFGLDPCFSLGGGMEWVPRRSPIGGIFDARIVTAPARTEPAHAILTLRAGVSLRDPRRQ